MEETNVLLLQLIEQLKNVNEKLDCITGGGQSSIENISDKLDSIRASIQEMGGAQGSYTIEQVCDRLDLIDGSLSIVDNSLQNIDTILKEKI